MPPLPRHQTQHASAPRIRVCVRSMANKQLLDTQVSRQSCGGPKQLFVRDEQQPIVISQHQPRCGQTQSLSTWDKVPKHPSTHHHVTLLQVVERHSHLAAATQEKNTIHMFCINAWVASSSFCFLFFFSTKCLSSVLFMWLTLRYVQRWATCSFIEWESNHPYVTQKCNCFPWNRK